MKEAIRLQFAVLAKSALLSVFTALWIWEAACGAEPQDIAFTSKLDRSEQRYVQVLPDSLQSDEPVSVLIALHGHGSDRWQFARTDIAEARAAQDAAKKYGMIYVSPDYRAKTSWMGPAAEADVLQIIDDLKSQYRISKVVICGASMGGTSALTFAALHPEVIDGVVSMNGTANLVEYDQFQDAIAASYGGSKTEKPDEYRRRSSELHADKLTMPIAMTTGGQDKLVPPDSVLRLAETLTKLRRPALSIHQNAGGHDTKYEDAAAAFAYVLTQVVARPVLAFGEKPIKIVCLGDSVTGVYYHTGGRRAFPEMLEVAIKQAMPNAAAKVINAGISGHSTTEGLARLETDVLAHKPDLVTISFGLNDVARGSEEAFSENLKTLVTKCREAKANVVLCTPNSVLTTSARPIENVSHYSQIIRLVASELDVPVCDQFTDGEALKAKDAWAFRTILSDEIHPNMAGHKLMAEGLCRTITGKETSLAKVGPIAPALVRTRALVEAGKPVKVLAMSPLDKIIATALQAIDPKATVEVIPWIVDGKSLVDLESEAQKTVRAMKPDLVVLAIPPSATAEGDEAFFRAYSWTMNWSLSFGLQEWDVVVVHPDVAVPDAPSPRADLIRQLVASQDLPLIDRPADDKATSEEIFIRQLKLLW
jgi:lysophospholipase L1-like esterase/predicted esterase